MSGLGKLSTSDSQALSDPEVLRRLTDKVSSAMDEAASTVLRIKAEQQKTGSAYVCFLLIFSQCVFVHEVLTPKGAGSPFLWTQNRFPSVGYGEYLSKF